jgi:hypothetical protein
MLLRQQAGSYTWHSENQSFFNSLLTECHPLTQPEKEAVQRSVNKARRAVTEKFPVPEVQLASQFHPYPARPSC